MHEIPWWNSFAENRLQTTFSIDIPVNIAPIEKPDKKKALKQMKTCFTLPIY